MHLRFEDHLFLNIPIYIQRITITVYCRKLEKIKEKDFSQLKLVRRVVRKTK